ncbi:MAG: glycosyltransferase family 4 protein [Crocinitomicaceae bacterium]|nr:glycosyltransferase family 4 protein [Crocinitomicaceae bacterium]
MEDLSRGDHCISNEKKRILILYRELAGYIVSCIDHLSLQHHFSIDVVAYPVNPEAPFKFVFNGAVTLYDRSKMSDDDLFNLSRKNSYSLILCGGWIDKGYIRVVKGKRTLPAVVAFDKQWKGSIRDFLAAAYLRFTIRPLFDYAFVAGTEQFLFARRMGFPKEKIREGIYAGDVSLYGKIFYDRKNQVTSPVKRKMWYAGRYIAQKAFNDLFAVFSELADGPLIEWELHAVGTGDQWEERIKHPSIIHHGFVQPADLIQLIADGELFILPSLFEPWGVVVHEFAAAGFPLILSDSVGARTFFLKKNINGITFKAGNREELKNALTILAAKSRDELEAMGRTSHELAMQLTPETWSQQVLTMIAP